MNSNRLRVLAAIALLVCSGIADARFISMDPQPVNTTNGSNFNRYWYANDNPYRYTDPDGRQEADVSEEDVESFRQMMQPNLVPVTPQAEGGNLPTAPDALGEIQSRGDQASAKMEQEFKSGSYTNTHESGKTYDGKGSPARAAASARRVEGETGDRHVKTDHTGATNDREAFKQESRRLDSHGGPSSPSNYNKIESPGKKMRQQDDELPRKKDQQ